MAINNDLGAVIPDYNTPEEMDAARQLLEWCDALDLMEILGL